MGLRDLARRHFHRFTTSERGFGWEMTLVNPEGVNQPITGYSQDIAAIIDPETGSTVSGRLASVSVSMDSLQEIGFDLPNNYQDWHLLVNDVLGRPVSFRIREQMPDRTIGSVTLILELRK